ncbi:hypothetical protein ACFWCF_24695 [Rhodococcus sp. NPDC060090]|uniref:hypothetical protein n=1 Tax=Rhodococcus sp. NPDC060090 TaxID=3347056 RepID=UPI00364765EF
MTTYVLGDGTYNRTIAFSSMPNTQAAADGFSAASKRTHGSDFIDDSSGIPSEPTASKRTKSKVTGMADVSIDACSGPGGTRGHIISAIGGSTTVPSILFHSADSSGTSVPFAVIDGIGPLMV